MSTTPAPASRGWAATVTDRGVRCRAASRRSAVMMMSESCAVSGVTGIALTKLDVLDGFDKVRICTGYRLNGKVLDLAMREAINRLVDGINAGAWNPRN